MKEIEIFEVGGFRIGQAQNEMAATGCTVILFDKAAPTGVDIRGGGPASRETPLLAPTADAKGIHALIFSGGSAFGLDAAGGVMRYLEERDIGFDVGVTKVPLVCASSLFDLVVAESTVRPDAEMAYQACEKASNTHFEMGCVGAGTGCTVGKYSGIEHAMKSGIGAAAAQIGKVKVGAVVAVNALGDIFDAETGKQIAGMRDETGKNFKSTKKTFFQDIEMQKNIFSGNTTIGAIITNAAFEKSELTKIASMAHNGFARAISPVHTMADGDSIYASSTGNIQADINAVSILAAEVMEKAIKNAIFSSKSLYGIPAAKDLIK